MICGGVVGEGEVEVIVRIEGGEDRVCEDVGGEGCLVRRWVVW